MNIALAMLGALGQGMLWGVMALGVYITFKLLDFADMTCDGSFALGGCVSIIMTVNFGCNPFLSLIIAIMAGMLAGAVTGFFHTKLKIPAILSGILTMIALYSVNLRIMGQPNLSLMKEDSIVTKIKKLIPESIIGNIKSSTLSSLVGLLIGILVVIFLIGVVYWFFGTEIGSAIRATGNNEDMMRAQGQNTNKIKLIALLLSNGLIALSGALVAQAQGYADVGMGQGTIVIGLASIVIGEVILGHKLSFGSKLLSVIIGSVVYRLIIAIILQLGLNTSDLKLLTALLVAVSLSIPVLRKSRREYNKRTTVRAESARETMDRRKNN